MGCELVLEVLPDYALGTLDEEAAAAVRRHLRGCAACRADAAALDRGVAAFTGAAHAAVPPSDLKDRVLAVLDREWAEAPPARGPRRRPFAWIAAGAAAAMLTGALSWGAIAQHRASSAEASLRVLARDAAGYRTLLATLGGRDVRVARLEPQGAGTVWGTAVLYDSTQGRSWVLVMCRGWEGSLHRATVSVSSADGRTITFPSPMTFDASGNGTALLVTGATLRDFTRVVVAAPDGSIVAAGSASTG